MAENAKAEIEDELRSVVQSVKGGIPLKSVQGDFKSLTGSFIPYGKFGYSSLEAMLRDMPRVVRIERCSNGDLLLHAVATESTQHLTELISKQRTTKPRHISKPRRPIGNQRWKPPTPHRSGMHLPSRPPSRNSQNMYRHVPPYYSHFNSRPCLQPISSNVPSHGNFYNHTSGKPLLRLNLSHMGGPSVTSKPIPPVKSNFEVPPRFQKQPVIPARVPPPPLPTLEKVPSPASSPLSTPPFSPDAPEFVPRLPASGSTSPPPIEPGLPWPNPRSNKDLVDNYAFINGLKCVYRPCEHKSKKKHKTMWLSQLILEDQKFLSYPVEMNSAEEANEEAAKRAVEKLNIHPDIISLPVVPSRSATEKQAVIEQVIEIVSESSQGAVHYHVQDKFKKKHKMRLPPNWLDIFQNVEGFRIDRADDTHYILTYEKSSRSTPELPSVEMNGSSEPKSLSADSSGSEGDCYLPEAPSLPESKDWDIYVTHADNTANICFRLIDYADTFEEFAQQMEEYYGNNSNLKPVKNPMCAAPYCAFVEDSWHRVIVQNINDSGKVLCDFPDVGDSIWLESSLIYELDKKFLDLPFQAFRGELAGLGCFANDPVISGKLIHRVIGKALVAEPTERDDTISLVLYDTSTDDDVNINKTLLEEIFAEIVPPTLDRTGMLLDGFLGDVLPSGDVFLHISGRSSQLLTKLMDNVTDIFQLQRNDKPLTRVVLTEMYSAFYKDKWHRAMPAAESITADKVTMILIDVGIQTDVILSNICKFDGDTKMLSQFPPLAVCCHLNGISEDTKKHSEIKEKLTQLVPEGTPLLIKVASKTTGTQLPVVDLFKRLEPSNNELISINQTLAVFFSLSETEPCVKVESRPERKLSRPNSLQSPSTPPLTPPIFTTKPSSPTDILSPSSSYCFVENVSSPFGPSLSGYPLDTVPLNKDKHDICFKPSFGNASLPVLSPGSSFVMTTPLSSYIPGSPGAPLDCKNVCSYTPVQETLPSITPPIVENSVEMEICKQEDIPAVKEYFDVFVTSAANPNNFICQSRKACNATATLFEEMQRFYSCEDNICEMHQVLVEPGKFFALKHKDGFWYRVCVQEIILKEPFTMLVFLVDYGGYEMAKLTDIQVLYSQFCKLPYQAISASLSGVQAVSGDYSPSNCLEFKTMVEDKNFVSIICAKEPRKQHNLEGTHLSLQLVDTSTSVDVYVHEELFKKNIAMQV